jgi:spermidine synthase
MRPPARFFVFLGLFFLSGTVALVYEVLWLRRIGLLFGSTAFATAATLGAFMAGLGLGGHLGGRRAARAGTPLRTYGFLELGVAAGALLVDPLLGAADSLLGWLYSAGAGKILLDAARLVLSLLVLLAPTTFMGATLPLLAQSAVRSTRAVAAPLGLLYGANTLGAALGSFVAAFFLLERFGTRGSFAAALVLNALIAVAALLASRNSEQDPAPPRSPAASTAWLPLLAFALSGGAALVCEVVWTRRLVFFIGNTSYAFALMLTLFLLGIALGSCLGGRLGDRIESAFRALAVTFAFAGAGLAAGALLLPSLAFELEPWMMNDPTWTRMLAYMVALAGLVVLPPAMAFGAVFPLVARAEVTSGWHAGPAVGAAYAANICGAVTGAYAGGFLLVPLLGLSATLRLTAAALLSFAGFLSWRGRSRLLAAGLLGAAASIPLLPAETLHRIGPGESLLHYEEGASATVSVVRDPLGSKTLYVDGVPVAGTDPVMQTDQKSLAHLPMLLHEEARRVLTVGFGSGGASWSYTRYPSLERIDCVEIAPEVVRAAPHLREANHDLFSDRRYRIVIDDARSFLEHTSETYDVIATDCTDLQYRGNASLYTADYFDLCRRRLNPKGLVVVWMPLGGMSDSVFRMALATFASVFGNVSVWYMNNYPTHYLLLVGSEEEHAPSWDRLLSRISIEDVREDLDSIGLADPFRLLSTFLLDDRAVRRLVRGSELNRDELPLLELRAPRSTDRFAGARNLETALELAESENPSPPFETLFGERQRETIQAKLEPYLRASRHLNRGHVLYQNGLQDFQAAMDRYRDAAAANPLQESEVDSLVRATERTRDALLRAYAAAASAPGRSPGVLMNWGLTLLAAGRFVPAMEAFEDLAEERPELADAHLNLSRAALLAGEIEKALRAAENAVEAAPLRADVHFQKAMVLERSDRLRDALDAYENALRLRPEMVEARFNRGTILAGLGRLEEAREEYERGLSFRPGDDRARMNFAGVLLLQGDEATATIELRKIAEAGGSAAPRAAEILERLEREMR